MTLRRCLERGIPLRKREEINENLSTKNGGYYGCAHACMHQKKNFKVTFGASTIIVAHWLVGCHFEVANVMKFIYFSVTIEKQFLLYRDVKGSY